MMMESSLNGSINDMNASRIETKGWLERSILGIETNLNIDPKVSPAKVEIDYVSELSQMNPRPQAIQKESAEHTQIDFHS